MALRKFDQSKIKIDNNPFSTTRASRVEEGVYIKDTDGLNELLISSKSRLAVKIGMLKKLCDTLEIIINSSPIHCFISADWGQGKSFTMRYIQEEIYSKFLNPIITISIGRNASEIANEEGKFLQTILSYLYSAFEKLDNDIFDKQALIDKYQPRNFGTDGNYSKTLLNFDEIFYTLGLKVFIFIDETEKVIIETQDQSNISRFLEELKILAELEKSISVWIAGTTNSKAKIETVKPDILQRFNLVEYNYFNENETTVYINEKCSKILKYLGYIPFTNTVKRKIAYHSGGNIRFIESTCQRLWRYSTLKQKRIDDKTFDEFIMDNAYEPIKTVLGSHLNDDQIKLISKLLITEKVGYQKCLKGLSKRTKDQLKSFNRDSEFISFIGRSLKLDSDKRQVILDKIFKE